MNIRLREITQDNAHAVLALRTTPAQERFVSTVAYSLQEAERHPNENPWLRAIYAGEQPVGFVMVAWDFVPEQREAVVRQDLRLDVASIASQLGTPEEAVKLRLSRLRARAALAPLL